MSLAALEQQREDPGRVRHLGVAYAASAVVLAALLGLGVVFGEELRGRPSEEPTPVTFAPPPGVPGGSLDGVVGTAARHGRHHRRRRGRALAQPGQGIAATGSGGLGSVSAGIAEALVETTLGLMVAIPAVLFFNQLNTRISTLEGTLARATGELLLAGLLASACSSDGQLPVDTDGRTTNQGPDVDNVQYGMLLRRNTRASIRNVLAVGFEASLDVRDAATKNGITPPSGEPALSLTNSIFWGASNASVIDHIAYPESGASAPNKDNDGAFKDARDSWATKGSWIVWDDR